MKVNLSSACSQIENLQLTLSLGNVAPSMRINLAQKATFLASKENLGILLYKGIFLKIVQKAKNMIISSAFCLVKGKALSPVPKLSGINRCQTFSVQCFLWCFSISWVCTRKTSMESGLKISSEVKFINFSKKEASSIQAIMLSSLLVSWNCCFSNQLEPSLVCLQLLQHLWTLTCLLMHNLPCRH